MTREAKRRIVRQVNDSFSFEKAARALCDKYSLPDVQSRRAFVELGAALDGELPALELIVLQRAYGELFKAIEDVYRPRTPLEAQAEYLRTRRQVREELGIELPDWTPEDSME